MKKIELVYIQIEKYRNLENLDMLLNNNFDIKILKNDDEIEVIADYKQVNTSIFRNNITNITALIGKNGIGKTNTLNLLGNNSMSRDIYNDYYYTFIYYNWAADKFIIESKRTCKYSSNQESYYNHLFKPYPIKYLSVGTNVDSGLFPVANGADTSRYGFNTRLRSALFYKHLYLYRNEAEGYKRNFGYIEINITRKYQVKEINDDYIQILPDKYPGKGCGFDNFRDSDGLIYKEAFLLRLVEVCINNIQRFNDNDFEGIIIKIKDKGEANRSVENYEYKDYIDVLVELAQLAARKHYLPSSLDAEDVKVVYIDKFLDCIDKLKNICDKSWFVNSHQLKIPYDSIDDSVADILSELFINLDEERLSFEFLQTVIDVNFSGLSSGLEQMITLYAGIYKCIENSKAASTNNIILLLDEPDERFHPEWSRSFLYNLSEFLKECFSEIDFQIILTTHSPFVMSDLTEDNIVLFDKDDSDKVVLKKVDTRTFGSDIHSLLISTGFMESTIGEYSKRMINDIISHLRGKSVNLEYDDDEILELINLIGEPILRKKLKIKFNNKFKNDLDELTYWKTKAKELETEIFALRGGENDSD